VVKNQYSTQVLVTGMLRKEGIVFPGVLGAIRGGRMLHVPGLGSRNLFYGQFDD